MYTHTPVATPLVETYFPSLPLDVDPLNTARVLGSAVSSPSEVWDGAQRQSNLVHFSLKI